MKHVTHFSLYLLLVSFLAACGGGAQPNQESQAAATATPVVSPSAAALVAPTETVPGPTPAAEVAEEAATVDSAVPESTTETVQETATSTPTIVASPTAAVVTNGRTEEGAYFLGRSDAPVTIIDYSDFM